MVFSLSDVINISIISEKNNRQEEFEDKVQSVKSIDIKQSPDFISITNEKNDRIVNNLKIKFNQLSLLISNSLLTFNY